MSHQCLQCGQSFPDGSAELLRGCPKCQGTRFFYTQAPVSQQERKALMAQANKDLKGILEELVKGGRGARPAYDDPLWSQEARRQWLQVDANKLRAHEAGAVQEVGPPVGAPPAVQQRAPSQPAAMQARAPSPLPPEPPEEGRLPLASAPAMRLPTEAPRGDPKPEVVTVHEPGTYEVDVKQLLEHSPVVVRRDGVYVVHLPSVFAATKR
ncbi:MAG TPA: Zn-ribbon containing protein [Candidatus Thermoplasmatota archaeon]|nr:Zn-ribbon containing protein [Candidatus Thermoplasmatota archaeon]